MKKLDPKVPLGTTLIGSIYFDDDPRILGEDMAEVELPNDMLVYCGWYNESDPDGAYRIAAMKGCEQVERVTTKSQSQAVELFEAMAQKYA